MSASVPRREMLRWLAAAAVLALAGCGRKARPIPPPDADPLSPRRYPVDKTLPPEFRYQRPEFVPEPPPDIPLPGAPLQGPLYPAQPGTDTESTYQQ